MSVEYFGTGKNTIIEPEKEKVNRNFKGIWISKEIWNDKKLTWIEKLFMVEIDSLDNDEGCFASNKYFAGFFDLSTGRVSQIINELIKKKYLSVQYEMNGKEIKKRVLKILNRYLENDEGVFRKSEEGYLENDKDNNTYINNTINNMSVAKSDDGIEKKAVKKSDYKDKIEVYNQFMLEKGFSKEQIDACVFNNTKEMKNLASLVKKVELDKLRAFLEIANKNQLVIKNQFLPSIIHNQYSQIMAALLDIGEWHEKAYPILTIYGEVFGDFDVRYTNDRNNRTVAFFDAIDDKSTIAEYMRKYKKIISKAGCQLSYDNVISIETYNKYR